MLNAMKLQASNPDPGGVPYKFSSLRNGVTSRPTYTLRLPYRRSNFVSFAVQTVPENGTSSEPSVSPDFTSTVGFSTTIHHSLTHGHIRILSFFALTAAVSATWLFCSAIPALLAFKRAAESLGKLMDVMTEELPDTMAAVRLSGMEISDLTMELSDIGQEITQGVRSSTRAVRMAEERLRRLTNTTPTVSVQVVAPIETGKPKLALARSARGIREGIVKGRSVVQMFFTLSRFSKMLLNYFKSRAKA